MSLPIHFLRKRLKELIKMNKRGYMAMLSCLSGVPDGTIHKIAYGKQKTVTYKVWKKLYEAMPELPAPPVIYVDNTEDAVAIKPERQYFIAALKHFYITDSKFKTFEDLALSVGLKTTDVKCLLKGKDSLALNKQQKTVLAHAFGLSLDEFINTGKSIIQQHGNQHYEIANNILVSIDKASTTHPEIAQIVKIAEKLDDKKIHALKKIALKMLKNHIVHEESSDGDRL
jgi:hypothetical protein